MKTTFENKFETITLLVVLMHQQHSMGFVMDPYHNHSVPGPEPSVSFGWILDDVMDVASVIITFGEGEAQAAFF